MSWNEARIALVPPGVGVRVNLSGDVRGVDARPVPIVEFFQAEGQDSGIQAVAFFRRLRGLGFRLEDENQHRIAGIRDDVRFLAELSGSSVTSVTLTFRFGRDVRDRIEEWRQLVETLCAEWQFGLLDNNGDVGSADRFEDVLKSSFAWECFLAGEL
jgi:hypothetical protein